MPKTKIIRSDKELIIKVIVPLGSLQNFFKPILSEVRAVLAVQRQKDRKDNLDKVNG